MSALKWLRVVNVLPWLTDRYDRWVLTDADADSDWVRDRGLIELYLGADKWAAYMSLLARGPETELEGERGEAIRILKQRLRELLTRLENEEVVP